MSTVMATEWHIGCSGFHYKEWKDEFYPKGLAQKNWFSYYATQFNTLELNVTFYRFPQLKTLENWFDKAPDGFSFSAKVPRTITHYKKFVDTEAMVREFYDVLRAGLRDKLACVLFQLPPQLAYSEEKLEKIISQTDPSFNNVIEFRNEGWWRPDVMKRLAKHGISFSGVSFPKISADEAVVNVKALSYYRFHGVPKLFYSEYDHAFLEKIYHQLKAAKPKRAYLYFNNTASLAALHNARYFGELVAGDQ
jgi:uncharacterized protein YecE (DUF72 family)